MEKRPKIIIFEINNTLFPFRVNSYVKPPFRHGQVREYCGREDQNIPYYTDVPDVLRQLSHEGYELGIASRTIEITEADSLLKDFGWKKYFKYIEISNNNKVVHFANIQKNSQVDYKDMLFFDYCPADLVAVGKLGVHTVLVPSGITNCIVESTLRIFSL